ncbi:YwqG family protein [Streptomyces nigrescens]
MTQSTADTLHTLAREHLPHEIAERWIGLLRPGLRLEKATGTAPVVGRLGGLPELPENEEWPVWEGHGPLSFVASLDCAALPSAALDITMPADGTLAWDDDFQEALWDHFEGTEHRIGGHAHPVQDEVETEVARGALGSPPWDDPRIKEEALRWVLLAQIDSDDDADMMWGDCGALYWLIRPEDLAERRFDRAMFTWQCG